MNFFYLFALVNGGFGPWSAFTPCSTSCGDGTKHRVRRCNNPPPMYGGKDCVGITTHFEKCNIGACPGNK